jgi:hypothetical protein
MPLLPPLVVLAVLVEAMWHHASDLTPLFFSHTLIFFSFSRFSFSLVFGSLFSDYTLCASIGAESPRTNTKNIRCGLPYF